MNSIKIIVNSLDTIYPSKEDVGYGEGESEGIEQEGTENEVGNANDLQEDRYPGTVDDIGERLDSGDGIDIDLPEKDTDIEPPARQSVLSRTFLFLPNYIIIKPLTFIWLLITYPFTYPFKQLASAPGGELEDPKIEDDRKEIDERKEDDDSDGEKDVRPRSRNVMSDIDEKTELLKQENIMANSIKSPTAYSKYIIPPPQRLYPLSRNPHKKRRKKTLILDLDETLIHSLSRGSPRSFNSSSASAPRMIEIKLNNVASLYYVHKRPYCDFFLKEISKWFELQIFTASVKEYADPIIDWLENDIVDFTNDSGKSHVQPPSKIFTRRYYRTDCTYREGVGYIKDLSKFFPKEEDLKHVIILDNSPISYALHEDNAVMIEGWINDQSDRDLVNLLPMLHSLSLCIDVRFILGLRSGEKVFER